MGNALTSFMTAFGCLNPEPPEALEIIDTWPPPSVMGASGGRRPARDADIFNPGVYDSIEHAMRDEQLYTQLVRMDKRLKAGL